MTRAWHIASFAVDDPDSVVEATLSCQFCLRQSAAVLVSDNGDGTFTAAVRCTWCCCRTMVALDRVHAWRLLAAPPVGIALLRG